MAAAGRNTRASWRCTTKTFQAWCPCPTSSRQMLQVAAAPAGDPVGKERHPVFHPGDALDFHKQEFPFHLQDKIQSAALGYGNFGPDPGGTRQAREAAGGQGLGHQAVGGQGVDANPAARRPGQTARYRRSCAPGGSSWVRRISLTGVETAGQGAGIRHMDPDAAAVRQLHQGQETLPALQEAGRNQGRGKTHRCRRTGRRNLWVWALINFILNWESPFYEGS